MTDLAKVDEPDDGLPSISPQDEVFVQHMINGDNQTEAYRKAFGTADNPSEIALWRRASRKANSNGVKAHLRAATLAGQVRVRATLEGQAQRMRQLSVKAEEKGEFSTAVMAEDKVNKLFGLYVTEDSGRDALQAVGSAVTTLFGKALADQIAKAQGMTLDLTAETVPEATETGDESAK